MSLEESELVAQSKESEKMNSSDLDREVQEEIAKRKEEDREWTESMEKHPRVGILPSPELLTEGSTLGEDGIDTVKDFALVFDLMNEIEALNRVFYGSYRKERLEKEEFGALINSAFGNSFDAIRHTANPTLDEYVIWYYTGHGRSKEKNTEMLSMPILEKANLNTAYNDSAKDFAKHLQDKPVEGGELCLHHVGYCGLYGLIAPWIASVKEKSQNSAGEKKNKHLIIILDSCYAGMIARDLEELNKEEGPWNQNGCSITIQTACGPDETTYGGYFTPPFVTLNKEQRLLDDLKEKWAQMKDEEKNSFCSLPLPSPKVVTTTDDSGQNNPTMEFSFNNGHKLTLFSDPGFFKFCDLSVFQKLEFKEEHNLKKLSESAAKDFMGNTSNFNILDYKLKTLENEPFAGFPMGLFLIEEPRNPKFAVCAHVHFAQEDTSKVGRINLVHHLKPQRNNILYAEDIESLSKREVKKGIHEIEYAVVSKVEEPYNPDDWEYWKWDENDPSSSVSFNSQTDDQRSRLKDEVNKGAELVKACHDFVECHEQGRWNDLSRWNMTSRDKSYKGQFRQRERSQRVNEYLKKYDKSTGNKATCYKVWYMCFVIIIFFLFGFNTLTCVFLVSVFLFIN